MQRQHSVLPNTLLWLLQRHFVANPLTYSIAPKVLVPIANGSEEIETVTIIDVLRRANIEVKVAKVAEKGEAEGNLVCEMSRGVKLVADTFLDISAELPDMIVLPGGLKGADTFAASKELLELLKRQKECKTKWLAAICASPAVVLARNGLIAPDEWATCYPRFQPELPNQEKVADTVVVCGNLITSQGPGTTMQFSLTLVEMLISREKADELAKQLIHQGY
ncbi:hypothetical protein FGO68_gene16840 [Halteria grandinella]|uniref:DJ-1/PfpI domain-containing protein n=1 Tax=Halteria grandinella TaxID=5974 RepID=A0A8J8NEG9_HALGN|nr:hypothetical protein FGO68_gene16840 [Halteria grandinella]